VSLKMPAADTAQCGDVTSDHVTTSVNIIQIVTCTEVISEICVPVVGKCY